MVPARAMTVAHAAPLSSIRGMPNQPKIRIGSRARLVTMAATMIIAGKRVSPPALMEALATIGTTSKAMPPYQISM